MSDTKVIVGCGGMGIEAVWAADAYNLDSTIFVDDDSNLYKTKICGLDVTGSIEDCISTLGIDNIRFICAVGSVGLKKLFVRRIGYKGRFFSVVDGSVCMSEYVNIGVGTLICAGCIITTQVSIGKHVIVNVDCTVGHDVVIEDYVNVSPGVHISGYCLLKEGCNIGLGVNILPHITIGRNSVVGAGASVIRDVPDNVVVVGVPAKILREI